MRARAPDYRPPFDTKALPELRSAQLSFSDALELMKGRKVERLCIIAGYQMNVDAFEAEDLGRLRVLVCKGIKRGASWARFRNLEYLCFVSIT